MRELSVPKERRTGKVDLRRCPDKQSRSLDGVEAVQAQGGILDQLPGVERAHLVYREVGWAGGSRRVHLLTALDRQQLRRHCRIISNRDLTRIAQAQILTKLDDLCREVGASLLFVTHDFGVAAEICEPRDRDVLRPGRRRGFGVGVVRRPDAPLHMGLARFGPTGGPAPGEEVARHRGSGAVAG